MFGTSKKKASSLEDQDVRKLNVSVYSDPNLSIRTHSLVFIRGIQKFLSFYLFSECKTSAHSPPPPLFKEKN